MTTDGPAYLKRYRRQEVCSEVAGAASIEHRLSSRATVQPPVQRRLLRFVQLLPRVPVQASARQLCRSVLPTPSVRDVFRQLTIVRVFPTCERPRPESRRSPAEPVTCERAAENRADTEADSHVDGEGVSRR